MHPDLGPQEWGVTVRAGMWPVTVRILFVIDGRIVLNKDEYSFGLGYVLETLRATWSWWVGFEVDVATREESISEFDLGGNAVRYSSFRFTQSDFDIDSYNQIWFFGDQPSQTDGSDATTDDHILPPYTLDDDEVRRIASWMDRGGGVFATGDHNVLGASLCSRIPRVRTMRRWKRSEGVPTLGGPRRHQTLQGGSDFLGEGDALLQPVELVTSETAHALPFLRQRHPHPLMCSSWGPIDRFPDHMHEGDLVPDEFVELDRPLGIPGYDRPEYPEAIPEVLAAGAVDAGTFRRRPRPQIVAFGQTTNSHFPDELALLTSDSTLASVTLSKRFGLVSAYDGHVANVGRVVTDSTWHHWLSINLVGIAASDPAAYRKMQAYYRNVGLWLASQDQQRSMLISASWGALIGTWPGFFTHEQDAWDMGDRAVSVFQYTMSPCWLDSVVAPFLDAGILALRTVSGDPKSAPDWKGLPPNLINRAVVGSICRSLFDQAAEHRRAQRMYDHVDVDRKRINELGVRGAVHGLELLRDTVGDAARSFGAMRDQLEKGRRKGGGR